MSAPPDDLSELLDSWKYEEGNNIRRVRADDGREVLQVRLPLGIEQYEIDGRPDGERPSDFESWLDCYRQAAEERPWDFRLEEPQFQNLRDESLLYYHRYLLFFQISDYVRCARDTRRNLDVLDFVGRFAPPELVPTIEQYRPYILRMHVMARALDSVQSDSDVECAITLLDEGIDTVEELPAIEGNPVFALEKARSLRSLRDLRDQLSRQVPKTEAETLQEELDRAVEEENYEEAARLRDELARLPGSPASRQDRR